MSNFEKFFVDSTPYGGPHLVVLACFVIVMVLLITLSCIYAKTERSKVYVIKITAGITLFGTIISRFIYNDWTPTFLEFLPNTFCSTMGFILPLFVLFCKKDSKNLFYALFAGFMDGLITILSGDDIGQIDVDNTIISYFYHSLMVTLPMLCVALKYCRPTLDKVPRLVIGFAFMVVYGVFSNQTFNYENNMYLNEPLLEGTPLTWWVVGFMMIGIAIIVTLIYEAITEKWQDQHLYKSFSYIKEKGSKIFKKKEVANNPDKIDKK